MNKGFGRNALKIKSLAGGETFTIWMG